MQKENRGKFIIFEGVDKTGKTTQLNLIKESFINNNYINIITSFEPGDSVIGSVVRSILIDKNVEISNLTEFFLFISDRLEHSLQLILKNINNGKVVIVDRFHFSTFSYQVFPAIYKLKNRLYKNKDEKLALKTIVKMDKIFGKYLFSLIKPDIIFYFYNDKINYHNLEKNDRFESRGDNYLNVVLKGYEKSFSYYKNFNKIVRKIQFSNVIEKNKNIIFY